MPCARLFSDATGLKPEQLPIASINGTISWWQMMQSRRWLEDENEAEDWRSKKNRGAAHHPMAPFPGCDASCCRYSVNSLGLPLNPASAGREDEQLTDAQ